MAYTAGATILDDEYNAFVNNSSSPFGYNHFAGTGSAQYGLGQSAISTVARNAAANKNINQKITRWATPNRFVFSGYIRR